MIPSYLFLVTYTYIQTYIQKHVYPCIKSRQINRPYFQILIEYLNIHLIPIINQYFRYQYSEFHLSSVHWHFTPITSSEMSDILPNYLTSAKIYMALLLLQLHCSSVAADCEQQDDDCISKSIQSQPRAWRCAVITHK